MLKIAYTLWVMVENGNINIMSGYVSESYDEGYDIDGKSVICDYFADDKNFKKGLEELRKKIEYTIDIEGCEEFDATIIFNFDIEDIEDEWRWDVDYIFKGYEITIE